MKNTKLDLTASQGCDLRPSTLLPTQWASNTQQRVKRRAPQAFAYMLVLLSGFLSLQVFAAQPFDCGSTGANGAWSFLQSTNIALPPDGIFNCTTITIPVGVTVKFIRNSLNTPVYLLATGDVTIGGTIDVSANGRLAGPGGFDGGYPALPYEGYQTPGDGFGPGRGTWNWVIAAFGTTSLGGGNTNTYGNSILYPLIGGSGAYNGGGGGGAILIASNTRISVSGSILSDGGPDSGSGGAIKLVAPVVAGNGFLSALGATTSGGTTRVGGHGRIRIDCTDFLSWRNLSVSGVSSIGSRMVVFPPVIPQLDIIEVAGTAIPEGTNSAVSIELPIGSPTNQTVKVQARNFTNDVPIRVVVTPENAPSSTYDAVILQASGNPPSTNVDVVLPAGQIYHVDAWTR
jgi:hypothetical protein